APLRSVRCYPRIFLPGTSFLALLVAMCALSAGAQFKRSQSPSPQTAAPKEPTKSANVPPKSGQSPAEPKPANTSPNATIDSLKLPAVAIVILCEHAQQPLGLLPP